MSMNLQPFYCSCEVDGLSSKQLESVIEIQGVLKDSIEYYNSELLFTATREISEVEIGFNVTVECVAGDPCDLF